MSARVSTVLNFAAYQLAWFAVLIGAARGLAWAGAAVALVVAGAHVLARKEPRDLKLMGICLAIGLLVDSTLALTAQVHFADWSQPVAPYWMLSLWIAFATTLNHSLRWLMNQPVAAALAGAIGAPLAYLAGARLGALEIVAPWTTLPLIAVLWTPAMVALSMLVMRASLAPTGERITA